MRNLKEFILEGVSSMDDLLSIIATDLENTNKIKRIIKSTFPDTKFSKDDIENIIEILWFWEAYMESCSDADNEPDVYLDKIDQKLFLEFFEEYSSSVTDRAADEIYGLNETLCPVAEEVFKTLVSKITKINL